MNRVNSRNDFGHDDSTINIVMAIITIIIISYRPHKSLQCKPTIFNTLKRDVVGF